MSVEEKRELYRCGEDFKTLQDIETWVQYFDGQSYFFHTKVPKPGDNSIQFIVFYFNDICRPRTKICCSTGRQYTTETKIEIQPPNIS